MVKEGFTTNDQSYHGDHDILVKDVGFGVADLRCMHLLLVFYELGNLSVKSVSLLRLLLLDDFSKFTLVELGIVVGFTALHADEGIKKIFIFDGGIFTIGHLTHSDGVSQLFSDDRVSLDYDYETLFNQDFLNHITDLVGFIVSVAHAVSEEILDEGVKLGGVTWCIFLYESGHVGESIISQSLRLDVATAKNLNLLASFSR